VKGQHLYYSDTNQQFRGKGIGMPNVGEDIGDWIKVLARIKNESAEVNLVRIYELPTCALKSYCFEPFFREADQLGIYVVVPGTGTQWGWLPGPGACGDLQGCYEKGGVLGFGQKALQFLSYPNTFAIMIGNEFDLEMGQFMPVLKAYARDLKKHMSMCVSEPDSPSYQRARVIPLMYASSDSGGDDSDPLVAQYMFCEGEDVSVDIFGLNVERWCNPDEGAREYKKINDWVTQQSYPGAFMFSEMGCKKKYIPSEIRAWDQLADIFSKHPALDGFFGYVYYGEINFNMFDGKLANSTILQDGKNFFAGFRNIRQEPQQVPSATPSPKCPMGIKNGVNFVGDYKSIKEYGTGDASSPRNCPKPYAEHATAEVVV